MKSIIKIFLCACICIVAASCSTSTNITVQTTPGTEILTPQKTRLAVADDKGKAKFALPDRDYYAFLLSHSPSSEEYIPFALDYKYKAHSGARFGNAVGIGLAGAGIFTELIGALCYGATGGEDEDFGIVVAVGGGVAIAGLSLWAAPFMRLQQDAFKHQYKYLPQQTANQDITVTYPTFDVYEPAVTTIPADGPQVQTVVASSTSTRKLNSSTSSRTLSDHAAVVEGTYVGNGNLSKGSTIIEKYKDVSVVIKKSAKDLVLVNVVLSNGEQFFDEDGEYSVVKLDDGMYELKLKNNESAAITIDIEKGLVYIHPSVNIEGDIYTLSINANKK